MSTVTLVKAPHLHRVASILHALLRAPKGREHIFYVDGSEQLTVRHTNKRKEKLRSTCRAMKIPYVLHFFHQHAGLCGFWTFDDDLLIEAKNWFDMNAEQGVYPVVNQWRKGKQYE